MPVVQMKSLLEAGVHFGHRTRRWNPKMRPYIFTERNGIHIIDLQQTMSSIERAYAIVRDAVSAGGSVLFTGTKKQAMDTISFEAERAAMPFVNQRWLGGTLTNFRTIRGRIEKLAEMEAARERGEFGRLTKKEALDAENEIGKLLRRFGGMRDIRRIPDVLYVTDVRREALAVKEANILGLPVIALVDTNCDPDPIKFPIPANDDAIRAIKLITSKMADAAIEGRAIRQATLGTQEAEDEEREDERYLGPATLAKLRMGDDDVESEEVADAEADFEYTPDAENPE